MNKIDLSSFTYEDLIDYFKQIGQPSYRGDQVFSWIHQKKATSFSEMTNLSKDLRKQLEDTAFITTLKPVAHQVSKVDNTEKFLLELTDANSIETVKMSYDYGNTLCVSTQVGCRMGCKFCASTIGGLVRNLTAGEILSQIYTVEKITGDSISNVVLMGIGEPLDNFDNVVDFLRIISHEKGRNLSLRSITVSTCGIVPKIRELADLAMPITLAVSLHETTDTSRQNIMPIAKKYNIEELLSACKYYFDKTGRRITFEYALIQGVNDTPQNAKKLGELIKGINCHVNLIPVNPVREKGFTQSNESAITSFLKVLHDMGIAATRRRELGSDISAACGQLRHEQA